MKDEALLTITRVTDCEYDVEAIGTLDYRVHCQALERWLAAGVGRRETQTVADRQRAFADELRTIANAIEAGTYPFSSTVEFAEALAKEIRAKVAELKRAEMASVP